MTANLVRNGQIINSLAQAVASGSSGLNAIPALIKRVIEDGMYRHFIVDMVHKEIQFDSFEEFVNTRAPIGLETDIPTLQKLCKASKHDDRELREIELLIINEVRNPHGGRYNLTGKNQHSDARVDEAIEKLSDDSLQPKENEVEFDNIILDHNVVHPTIEPAPLKPKKKPAPTGTTKEYAMKRLQADHPELLEDVLAGKKSANTAMVEAGVRKRYINVRADDPKIAAKTIIKYCGTETTKALIEELTKLLDQ